MPDGPLRILIVDDEASLRDVMTTYLGRLGYDVVACPTGDEAWRLVEGCPSGYSVALVDVNMPGMPGEELARRILAANHSIRLIMASGYPEEMNQARTEHTGRIRFLHKPFTPSELAQAVGEALQRRSTQGVSG
jgi:two-component system cell cycle sensor histidine kinase/response regulator CckA